MHKSQSDKQKLDAYLQAYQTPAVTAELKDAVMQISEQPKQSVAGWLLKPAMALSLALVLGLCSGYYELLNGNTEELSNLNDFLYITMNGEDNDFDF